jgi:Fic family protein
MTHAESADEALFPTLTRTQTIELTRLVSEIDEFKGKWRRLKEIQAEKLAGLRQVATIESAASSTRIEGAELTDGEVAQVLSGLRVDSFRARDEDEVRGYGEVLELVFESHADMQLTENHIKQLHAILLRHTAKDERHRGEYKKLPNDVVAKHSDGSVEVVFQTATAFDTPRRMSALVEQTNRGLEQGDVPALIVIARFVVEFLAIHPFQDGNGRLSRALTTLLLLRAGYDYAPYASHERIIEDNKLRYYAALRESQLAMRDDPAAFGGWTVFFLGALRAQKRVLEAKLDVEQSMRRLSAVQEQILGVVSTHGRTTSSQLVHELSLPERTIRYHLQLLVARNLLAAHGQRRGRHYTLGAGDAIAPSAGDSGFHALLAEIYEGGKRIKRRELTALVKRHGYDGRVVGILHGRRQPSLRRDPKTGESVLTARGEEIARQYLFTKRLADGARAAIATP